MKPRVAVINAVRTPFAKASTVFNNIAADDLGAIAVREVFTRTNIDPNIIDEVIIGNVIQPSNEANIARIIAVKAGLPINIPAYTVNRNCASGMEAVTSGVRQIQLGQAQVVLSGGVESMSNFPVEISREYREFLARLSKAKGLRQKLMTLLKFRPRFFIPQMPSIKDSLCDLTMGQTAENVVRDFKIARQAQDEFSLRSHQRASKATETGRFKEEIVPVPLPPDFSKFQLVDEGPRANQTLEALQKLKPVFDPLTGSVTAGSSSPLTDGAAAMILMSEEKAKELGLTPLAYIVDYAEAGLDPARMGLGPVYSITKLLNQTGLTLDQIDLIEINEAFAGQVLGVLKAFESDDFAKKALKRDKAVGKLDIEKLNVNGGAIAIGHPLGASGARLIMTLIFELRKQKKHKGIASLCIGGGQGQACLIEVE